jgi:hypothetical protein
MNPFWQTIAQYASEVRLPQEVADRYASHGRLTFAAKFFLAVHLTVDGRPWGMPVHVLAEILGCRPATASKVRTCLEADGVVRFVAEHSSGVHQFCFAATIPHDQPAPPPRASTIQPSEIPDGVVGWDRRRRFRIEDVSVSIN